ncbi:coiled-coil domain-containing protein 142 isoform X2 [Hyla sarda]|uniref:coiled-coil domain-containing protein 142 isoform X2 n=1 Tax=Hyla sarda TaxID=327740 RepID=UPI0024C210B4|nr:coiled-coil domain-containing protein 142 isoform X2 [Hyla sarda]
MSRRQPPWSDHRHGFPQGSASSPRSPVLLQSAQFRNNVISEGEELTQSNPGRHNARLQSLCRQRQLLLLVREFVVHQMRLLEYYKTVEQTPLSRMEAACLRLQELCHGGAMLQRRVRANQLLRPLSPAVHQVLGDLHRTLQLMSVKAAIVTEELVLSAVRRMARLPSEVSGSLCRALTVYNKVIADILPWAAQGTDMQPISITRSLEIMAEERGRLLAESFSQAGLRSKLEHVLNGEVESQKEVGGALSSCLKTLMWEDRCQAAPLLKNLAGLDHMMGSGMETDSAAEPVLYEQYCSRLWPVLCAHLFHAMYPGRWGARTMPALTPCVVGVRTAAAIQLLRSALTSDAVPELCQEWGHRLCHHLLCTTAFITWDRGMCQALSSALTDKCVTLLQDDGARKTHSRTAAALVAVCQEVSVLLHAMSSGRNISSHQGVLSRCVMTLQLCDLWVRSRCQIYTSSGSLGHLLLVSHGDLPVIKEQMQIVTSATHNVEWPPVSQGLHERLQNVSESLEGVALSLPHLLGSMCAHQAQDIFQHVMPGGRHWRGKVASGPDLVPSEYAQAAVNAVLMPILEGVRYLSPDEQISAVSITIGVFMEAWMEHILRERLKFSLQGALQLRCDFEVVRNLLKSPELGMSPEVIQAAMSLPVFQQADNAIVCLLQQPSRKAYLQSRGCSIFCCPPLCRTTVESLSDSLQSLDSLGRRVWSQNYSANRPQHSHDSYLPQNQRQWLSLRLHKSWTGLG